MTNIGKQRKTKTGERDQVGFNLRPAGEGVALKETDRTDGLSFET